MPSDSAQKFANTITELSLAEINYSEDFFAKNVEPQARAESSAVETLQAYTSDANPHVLSATMSDAQVDDEWIDQHLPTDGQLPVDVIETEDVILILSAVAGLKAQDLDVTVQADLVTIAGARHTVADQVPTEAFLTRECWWGNFSRSIILPAAIQHDRVTATLDNGLLTITLPKSQQPHQSKIEVIDVSA